MVVVSNNHAFVVTTTKPSLDAMCNCAPTMAQQQQDMCLRANVPAQYLNQRCCQLHLQHGTPADIRKKAQEKCKLLNILIVPNPNISE